MRCCLSMALLPVLLAASPWVRAESPLRVLATTTLVGDVAAVVGGGDVHLDILLDPGQDPHTFEPSPRQAALFSQAELILVNGFGLESFLERLLRSTASGAKVVEVSEGVEAIETHGHDHHAHGASCGAVDRDPHVWFDPLCVEVWVDRIEQALSEARPALAPRFRERADAYRQQLRGLDVWIRDEVSRIPAGRRKLVADHRVLAYFARRYGFEQPAVITESFSTMARPSARHLARLETALRQEGVGAIFAGVGGQQQLAERIARDTGVRLVLLHTGSLGEPGGEAGTYLDFMRHNVRAICGALSEVR